MASGFGRRERLVMSLNRWWAAAVAVAAQFPSSALGQTSVLQDPALRRFVAEVLERNEGYAAAGSRVSAAAERIAPAGALPDPTLTLGVLALPVPSFDFSAERMTRIPVGFRQRFPFPGKQAAATELARAESELMGEALGSAEAALVETATETFYELARTETATQIWRARVGLADQAIAVAQSRYETGRAEQTDVLRAQLRGAELEEKGRQLEAAVDQIRARLDGLRGGRGDSVVPILLVRQDGRPGLDVLRDSLVVDDVVRTLAQNGPALRVAQARVTRAERNVRVYELAGRPDFTVSVETGIRSAGREPFLTALVGVSLPIRAARNQAPATRSARHEAEAARQDYDDLLARLIGELRDRMAHLRGLRERIELTAQQIVPLARATSNSALQRYQVGRVEFTAVLDTQDELFRAELRLAWLLADYAIARAEIAALVGEEWYR